MESTLPSLTLLDSLHVIGCPKVDQDVMMRLFTYLPQIQSLAFTSYVSAYGSVVLCRHLDISAHRSVQESVRRTPPVITPLPRLRHLAIETQWGATPGESTPAFWTTVVNMTRMWSCPIKSISLKLSDKIILQDAFVSNLVASYHASLTHLTLRNLALSAEGVTRICRDCTELESLKLSVPAKGMVSPLPLCYSDIAFDSYCYRINSRTLSLEPSNFTRSRTWVMCMVTIRSACTYPNRKYVN